MNIDDFFIVNYFLQTLFYNEYFVDNENEVLKVRQLSK